MNKSLNPFQKQAAASVGMSSDEARAIQEVQAALIIANRFPRDEAAAMDAILQACTRPALAELGQYAYPRGGTVVSDGSIRLAEAIAQRWGNLEFGVRELSQTKGESVVESFCWDLQSNVRERRQFVVKHSRKAHGRTVELEDSRDIYEMAANLGARRLRACIFAIVPREVVDAAKKQCEITLQHSSGAPADEIKKLVAAFQALGVTAEQLRRRLGHTLESTIAAEVIGLRKIYASLRDGMSAPPDWFPEEAKPAVPTVAPGDGVAELTARLDKVASDNLRKAVGSLPQETLAEQSKHRETPPAPADDEKPKRRTRKAVKEESVVKDDLGWEDAPFQNENFRKGLEETLNPPTVTLDPENPDESAPVGHPDFPKRERDLWKDETGRIYSPYDHAWDPVGAKPVVNYKGRFVSKQKSN